MDATTDAVKTGTSTLGITFDGGVVVGAFVKSGHRTPKSGSGGRVGVADYCNRAADDANGE